MKGIDVSYYQGKIDWNAVRQSGIEFAILRAGFGSSAAQKDATFDTNAKKATAAGLNVGARPVWKRASAATFSRRTGENSLTLSIMITNMTPSAM